jgi:cell division protein FtsA
VSTLRVLGKSSRLKPLNPKKATTVSVLDIGSSKIACLIAHLKPISSDGGVLPNRTHSADLVGFGHQRSRGVKGGAIVDMDAAEQAIRLAVDAAERMSGLTVESLIVNLSAGKLASEAYAASVAIGGHEVEDTDIARVLDAGSAHSIREGRSVVHALPIGFSLDAARGIRDPRGMLGETLGVDMHVVTAESAPVRNILLCVERCHLHVDAVVATPYAAGLAALVDDEAELGVAVVDMGGGTTSLGVFHEGRFVHADVVRVGGDHVTNDIARGLATPISHAERLKTLHGSPLPCPSDEREFLTIPHTGEHEDVPSQVPRSALVRIIRPRVEETIELVRDRLVAAGFAGMAGRCIVLTGGAAQLTGLSEVARRILGKQVRIGRPLGISGLPESAKGPAFSTAVGLAVYPQVAGIEQFQPRRMRVLGTGTGGPFRGLRDWLRESF